jgi:hypothetical protein
MTTWASMFRPGFPGVKPARIASVDVHVQFLREPSEAGDGAFQIHAMRHAIAGLEVDVGGVRRKDEIEIEGVIYQAVTDAQSDGDGVCTIILEPAE